MPVDRYDLRNFGPGEDFSFPVQTPDYAAGEVFSLVQIRLPYPSERRVRRVIVSAAWPGPNPSPDPAAETNRVLGVVRGTGQGTTSGSIPLVGALGGRGIIVPNDGSPLSMLIQDSTSLSFVAVQDWAVSLTFPALQEPQPWDR